ncbi:unnamed protein product [Phytophthora fragariaefolia]|uniref:Unnamed protein product n=1 Tax=Phytophthora fragariaefolia TaxID=1490495 RepID=A0A9W6XF37_9STRA|nr:unnamed protein product [Phytophthora fragariaefolia]
MDFVFGPDAAGNTGVVVFVDRLSKMAHLAVVGDLVLLNAKSLTTQAVSAFFKTKLPSRFIGPFKVVAKKGLVYTLNLLKKMRTHPVFYVGLLKPYLDPARSSRWCSDAAWDWTAECQQVFDAVKQGLTKAPNLAVADQDRPFHVVCDASDFAIGCALMQHDHEGRDRVVYYQSRQLKTAERNYPVHDKELLAMKYAFAKFRVYLLGSRPFVVYTGHAALRTAIKSPHISQRTVRWLLFFAEYNFQVEYKPGRLNAVADALSRRPDYAVHKTDANAIGVERTSTPSDKSR